MVARLIRASRGEDAFSGGSLTLSSARVVARNLAAKGGDGMGNINASVDLGRDGDRGGRSPVDNPRSTR